MSVTEIGTGILIDRSQLLMLLHRVLSPLVVLFNSFLPSDVQVIEVKLIRDAILLILLIGL